jgi:hypothetical protein
VGCVQLSASLPVRVLAERAVNPNEQNSALQVYLQLGPYTPEVRAMQLLCEQVPGHL